MSPRRHKPANAGRRYPPQPLTAEECVALIRATEGERGEANAARAKAMLVTLYRSAIRASELCGLMPGDVDLRARAIHVRGAKGSNATELTGDWHNGTADRSRWVPIDGAAVDVLRNWLELRRELFGGDHPELPLFPSLPQGRAKASGGGQRLDDSYLRRLLPRLAKRAGIERRVHPHALRHTRAREWADGGLPVHQIRDLLGHASLATTDEYLRAIGAERYLDGARDDTWDF